MPRMPNLCSLVAAPSLHVVGDLCARGISLEHVTERSIRSESRFEQWLAHDSKASPT